MQGNGYGLGVTDWHILLIEPRREGTATAFMMGRSIKVFAPIVLKVSRRGCRGTEPCNGPLFPGYIFVQIDYNVQAGRVIATPGVRGFMRNGDGVARLPDAVIGAIQQQEEREIGRFRMMRGRTRPPQTIGIGDTVRMADDSGPFAGLYAKLAARDEGERVRVLLDLFGRETSMTVRANAIEPVSRAP